ncbi:HyaD/HybD family hydrogenase maturation endopeptidase [Campylobacter sp. Marseille-Q3452]|uniref:HyaD/HybD family hydrogenase maturation endopeptidase n=1 Tax=Campylobacter massiliensis TaxID=2762557 RepID=A0A842JBB3_9BACT|nr:HyaD/HybD family hydrogenase maturation endopeptidase [Campylobacter massiliensis]MBC2883362.1 HyaD/HybD family hydrogenase maturation endopeptidase [Campylobacter massiliensis]
MRVLVLGIGNVMFGDEGVGVHFVKMMEQNYKFSPKIRAKFDSALNLDDKFEASNLDVANSNLSGDLASRDGSKFNADGANLELRFIDGGTLAMALTPLIAQADVLIVVDCISADGGETGDVYFFGYEQMPPTISWNGSAHEVEMLETLRLMELAGDLPRTKILGIVPKRIEPMSFELSAQAQEGVNLMEKTLLNELSRLGFSYEKIANFSVSGIALEFSKKGAI